MSLNRTLGLAAVAALVAAYFVGTAQTSADTLCKANEDPCQKENIYTGAVHGLDEKVNFLGGVLGACYSEYLAEYVKSQGAHTGLLLLVTSFSFIMCPGECKVVKAAHLPFLAQAVALKGHVLLTEDGNGTFALLLEGCTFFQLKCEYEAEKSGVLFDYGVSEGKPRFTVLGAQLEKKFGAAFCPEKVNWDASYSFTEDDKTSAPLFLVALP